jgi:hypothetical protein
MSKTAAKHKSNAKGKPAKARTPKKSIPRTYEGLPVVDADEDMTLTVTPSDVAGSKKADPADCAAARSLKRTLHAEARVYLTRTYIKTEDGKAWVRFLTPMSVGREIVSFDRGSQFECGTYVVKAPVSTQRLGAWRGKKNTRPVESGRKMTPRHTTVAVRAFDKAHLAQLKG